MRENRFHEKIPLPGSSGLASFPSIIRFAPIVIGSQISGRRELEGGAGVEGRVAVSPAYIYTRVIAASDTARAINALANRDSTTRKATRAWRPPALLVSLSLLLSLSRCRE